jgi:hypothetical protein
MNGPLSDVASGGRHNSAHGAFNTDARAYTNVSTADHISPSAGRVLMLPIVYPGGQWHERHLDGGR